MVELADTRDSRMGLPRGDARVRNWVNSGEPTAARRCGRQGNLEPSRGGRRAWAGCPRDQMAGSAEGAETSGVSPNDNPRRRAPSTPIEPRALARASLAVKR